MPYCRTPTPHILCNQSGCRISVLNPLTFALTNQDPELAHSLLHDTNNFTIIMETWFMQRRTCVFLYNHQLADLKVQCREDCTSHSHPSTAWFFKYISAADLIHFCTCNGARGVTTRMGSLLCFVITTVVISPPVCATPQVQQKMRHYDLWKLHLALAGLFSKNTNQH